MDAVHISCRVGVAFLCFEGKTPKAGIVIKGYGHSSVPCLIPVTFPGERGAFLRVKEQFDFPETPLSGDSNMQAMQNPDILACRLQRICGH